MKRIRLAQRKNRIAWEIQALKDRQTVIAKKLSGRRALRIEVDETDAALDAEGNAIEERIEALTALDRGRRSLGKLYGMVKRIDAIARKATRDEIAKIQHGVHELRFALGI